MRVLDRTRLDVGSMRRRYGAPYSLTQTAPPAPAAAQGAAPAATLILATTVGPSAEPAATAETAAASRLQRRMRMWRRYSGSGGNAPDPD
jgi:hypothetical protein